MGRTRLILLGAVPGVAWAASLHDAVGLPGLDLHLHRHLRDHQPAHRRGIHAASRTPTARADDRTPRRVPDLPGLVCRRGPRRRRSARGRPGAGEGPRRTVGAHAPSLHRLLRTLASVGVFTEPEPGTFALTPLGQTLTSSLPGSMRDLAITWMETHYAPFAELIHAVRTGLARPSACTASLSSPGCRTTPSRPAGSPAPWPT